MALRNRASLVSDFEAWNGLCDELSEIIGDFEENIHPFTDNSYATLLSVLVTLGHRKRSFAGGSVKQISDLREELVEKTLISTHHLKFFFVKMKEGSNDTQLDYKSALDSVTKLLKEDPGFQLSLRSHFETSHKHSKAYRKALDDASDSKGINNEVYVQSVAKGEEYNQSISEFQNQILIFVGKLKAAIVMFTLKSCSNAVLYKNTTAFKAYETDKRRFCGFMEDFVERFHPIAAINVLESMKMHIADGHATLVDASVLSPWKELVETPQKSLE